MLEGPARLISFDSTCRFQMLAPTVRVLPHQLLGHSEDITGEIVVMTTADKEQYQCFMPQLTSDKRSVGVCMCVSICIFEMRCMGTSVLVCMHVHMCACAC